MTLNCSQSIEDHKNMLKTNGYPFQNIITIKNATPTTKTAAFIKYHIKTYKNIICNMALKDRCILNHKIIQAKLRSFY